MLCPVIIWHGTMDKLVGRTIIYATTTRKFRDLLNSMSEYVLSFIEGEMEHLCTNIWKDKFRQKLELRIFHQQILRK